MLSFQITDLDGEVKAHIKDHQGGEVVIPISDSRTAKVKISVFDKAAAEVKPLERMLKVYYFDTLVFWGVILTPVWKSSDGEQSVEINAHDPSLAWKKNFCRYGDRPVDDGIPIDGRGIRWIAECAEPGEGALAWVPPARRPGIDWGSDDSLRWYYAGANKVITEYNVVGNPPRPANINNPATGDGVWSIVERGTNCFEAIQEVSGNLIGPEWMLVPSEAKEGFYCKLRTDYQFGVNRASVVVFHRGFGRNNVLDLELVPDGDKVVNYAVEVWPGGEAGRRDTTHRAITVDASGWQKYGIYETWEASQGKDPVKVMQKRTDMTVELYHEPPNYFTLTPMPDDANNYRYLRDYDEGDEIAVEVRNGHMEAHVEGRIRQVTLSSDGAGVTTTQLECVPNVDATLSNTDTGE